MSLQFLNGLPLGVCSMALLSSPFTSFQIIGALNDALNLAIDMCGKALLIFIGEDVEVFGPT
jgi:hypothetical protein